MTSPESTRARQQQASRQPAAQGASPERALSKPSNVPAANLRSLHRAAGNRAVGRLLSAAQGQEPGASSSSAVKVGVNGRPGVEGPGAPLDPEVQAEMESRFGEELGDVRLHTGPSAEHAAQAVHARAYTVGRDVVFGAGQYAPQTPSGKKLLAHELAHTIQQSRGGGEAPSPLPGSPLEQEAERASTASPESGPVQVQGASAPGIARQPLSPEPQPKAPSQPQVSQDPNQAIRDVVQMLNSIQPSPNGIGLYTIVFEGETYEINEFQRQRISEDTRRSLISGINSVRRLAIGAQDTYDAIQDVNREFIVTSSILKFFGGIEDPGTEIKEKALEAKVYANLADAAFKEGDYQGALEALLMGEAPARRASDLAMVYQEGLVSAAETGKKTAAITRDVCLGISIGAATLLAAPVVAAGVGTLATGAGLTGATATGVTILGTGATITTGGAVAGGTLRGGASVVGQAIASGEISAEATLTEIKEGAKQGAVAAASGWATAGTAGALGQGTTLAGQITRGAASGSVGGATGGAVQGVLEGQSFSKILESTGKGALSGGVGGAFGGASAHLTSGSGLLTRMAGETVSGGAGSALGTAITGGSAEEIKKAAITGAITSGANALVPPAPHPTANKGGSRQLVDTEASTTQQQVGGKATSTTQEQPPIPQLGEPLEAGGVTSGSTSLAQPGTRPPGQPSGKTAIPTQELPPLPQITRPQEIVGEPVRLPETAGSGPLFDANQKPIGVIPPRRPPLVQVDEYGRPLPTPPRPSAVPRLIDPSQPPPRSRRPRPVLVGPDEKPLPPTRRRRSQSTKKKVEEPPKPKLYGPDDPVREPEPTPGEPKKLYTGEPEKPTPTGKPPLVDPSGQPIIPGARAKLEDPLLSAAEWQGGINARGLALERAVILRRYPNSTELPPNFKAFDTVEGGTRTPQIERPKKGPGRLTEVIEGGKAISIKSADLNGSSYQTAEGTYRSLSGYVDAIINFPKKGYALTGPDPQTGLPRRVRVVNPSEKVLHIELNQAPTPAQMEGLARLQFYGRQNNIEVIIVAPNSVAF